MTIDPVSIGVTLALTAAQMGLQMTRKIEGPRLEDLKVSVADYGTPLNYFYGTRRFEGCAIFFAEPIKEVKKKRKTKGGKYNDYTYYGTWAVAVADHEIEAVTRIWFDKHLVYDTTGAGPRTPFAFAKGFDLEDFLRIYLGTEAQEADPRMVATVETDHGAGSCPAYRGVSYVMFEEIPLEKFGNRIPQIAIEAVSKASPAWPYERNPTIIEPPERLWNASFSPDYSRFVWASNSSYSIWDVPTRKQMITGALSPNINLANKLALTNSGAIYAVRSNNREIVIFPPEGGTATSIDLTVPGTSYEQEEVWALEDGNGVEHLFTIPWTNVTRWYGKSLGDASLGWILNDFSTWRPTHWFTDSYGDVWCVGCYGLFNPNTIYFYRVIDTGARPGSIGAASIGVSTQAGPLASAHAVHFDGHFIVHWNRSTVYKVDDETFSIVDSASIGGDVYNWTKQWASHPPGKPSIWLNDDTYAYEISLSDLTILRSLPFSNWLSQNVDGMLYDPVNHALICAPQGVFELTWRFLDRIAGDSITLGSIVDDVAERCGIADGDTDTSALDQVVTGYSWVQGSGKDILEPIMEAYDSILRPHDFSIQGLKLDGATGGAIDVSQFVRSGDEPRYKIPTALDTDLPRSITFNFADIAADQQPNAVLAQRPLDAVDGVRELTIDMTPLALGVDEAKRLAERVFRRRWFEAQKYELSLTAQYLALEPGDVRTFNFDGIPCVARLDRATFQADGTFSLSLKRHDPGISTLSSSTGASMDGRVPSVILIGGPTKGFVLDVPLMRDGDDQSTPFAYLGAGPYGEVFWPGADFFQSDTGDAGTFDPTWAGVSSDSGMTWGFASNILGDAEPWVIDNGNTLNVRMQHGTLTSVTLDDLLISQRLNLILVSTGASATGPWEYIQFQTATLETDGSYTLSGLIRGQRGTEDAVGLHAAGDVVILAETAALRRTMGASEINDTDFYRVVTQGREETSAFVQPLTFSAAAQRPYSAVHGSLVKDAGSGDWTINAIRRTRIGGANLNGQDVPLGETAESWSADIMDGTDVVRTLTGSSLPLTYTNAMAIADFGSNPSTLDVNLYQVSPALSLRGYPLALAA